jgi:hypothetical protein
MDATATPSSEGSRKVLRESVARTARRARVAMGAIIAMAVFLRVGGILFVRALVAFEVNPIFHRGLLTVYTWPFWIVAAIFYWRWLYRAYADHERLGGRPLRFSPMYACASFFVPVMNFWLPYQALRDLYLASDPNRLPDSPRYEPAAVALYRTSAREIVPSPSWRKWCPLRSWWASFMILPIVLSVVTTLIPYVPTTGSYDSCFRLMARLGVASTLCSLLSTVFAVQVIRSIRARQGEELRRVEAAEELASAS